MLFASAFLYVFTVGGLFGGDVLAQILNDPDGLVNLRNVAQEVERISPENKAVPIVFGKFPEHS
jgi:hypothetical protein